MVVDTPATVADVAGQHGSVLCLGHTTLHDAVGLMLLCDRTAAVVVDDEGKLLGALTENDVLCAYAGGAVRHCRLDNWLQSGFARLPASQLQALTVHPTTSLLEAAALMRAQASTGDFASRHLVVCGEDGAVTGVLSALDMARALGERAWQHGEVARRIAGSTVGEVMKHKGVLPACRENVGLGQGVDKMLAMRQNCVLVGDSEASPPTAVGVLTTRDALRAFFEGIPLDVQVSHWLFCLGRELAPRFVAENAPLAEAATAMAAKSVHHLVVVAPGTSEIVGVLSSSDLAQALGSPERIVPACEA